jgi:hypothetical protein
LGRQSVVGVLRQRQAECRDVVRNEDSSVRERF